MTSWQTLSVQRPNEGHSVSYSDIEFPLCCQAEQAVDQTVELLVNSDALILMWSHCM